MTDTSASAISASSLAANGAPGRAAAEDPLRPQLSGSGWSLLALAVVLFALGVWLSYRELLVAAFAMAAAPAAGWMEVIRRTPLDVRREVAPDRVVEGEGASEVLTVSASGRRRSAAATAVERFAGEEVPLQLPGLAPGAAHRVEVTLPTGHRGCFDVGPLVISRSDRLGLVERSHRHDTNSRLWVHPRVHRMPTIPTGRSETFEGPTSLASPQGGVAFHSLREWQPGDDPRLIHWPSTAKTDTLMVRHTVITSEPRLLIVLDTAAASYQGQSFEEAVRVAASLMAAAARGRFPTEFRTTGGVTVRIDPAGQGLIAVFDELSLVEATAEDDGLGTVSLLDQGRQDGVSLGVVSGRPAPDKLDRLRSLRHRFTMVTLVRLDPDPGHHITPGAGILEVAAPTAIDFARLWTNRRAS